MRRVSNLIGRKFEGLDIRGELGGGSLQQLGPTGSNSGRGATTKPNATSARVAHGDGVAVAQVLCDTLGFELSCVRKLASCEEEEAAVM